MSRQSLVLWSPYNVERLVNAVVIVVVIVIIVVAVVLMEYSSPVAP